MLKQTFFVDNLIYINFPRYTLMLEPTFLVIYQKYVYVTISNMMLGPTCQLTTSGIST